jgi:hypothetical protein
LDNLSFLRNSALRKTQLYQLFPKTMDESFGKPILLSTLIYFNIFLIAPPVRTWLRPSPKARAKLSTLERSC